HDLPVEPTPDTLSLYAAYESHYISPTSVRTYLSGICHSLEPFYPNVRTSRCSDLVRNTVAGCVKMSAHTVNRKSPLAASDLARMLAKYGASDDFDDKLFLAILFVGFNALLRLGELVWPDSNALADYRKCIPFSSLAWRDALAPAGDGLEQFSFTLPGHKGNRFFEGDTVVVTDRPDAANALPVMRSYLSARQANARYRLHPALFVHADGSVPRRSWFIRCIRSNFPDDVCGHSIRSGGATDLALRGVPDNVIQRIGRWTSE
ncbi:hypothetical protein AURDEDRAFT_37400, partial [Auricularia subglabra TFB-10046 SS5]